MPMYDAAGIKVLGLGTSFGLSTHKIPSTKRTKLLRAHNIKRFACIYTIVLLLKIVIRLIIII